ncbi:hypothetical protein OROMI_016085 [Orobanche minor]
MLKKVLPKGSFKTRGTNFVIVRAKLDGKNEPLSDLLRQEVEIPPYLLSTANSTSGNMRSNGARACEIHFAKHGERQQERSERMNARIHGIAPGGSILRRPLQMEETLRRRHSRVGRELAEEINQALEKHGVEMRVLAMFNDTIGHLAGGRYYSKECVAAVSLGMGTDLAYIEALPQQIVKDSAAETAIDMQWGNFFSSNLPLTEYAAALDAESSDPGCSIFEKLVSGKYLGEIVRRVLLRMAEESVLFDDAVPPKLADAYTLRSPDMAVMHQDTSQDYEIV